MFAVNDAVRVVSYDPLIPHLDAGKGFIGHTGRVKEDDGIFVIVKLDQEVTLSDGESYDEGIFFQRELERL